MSYAVTKNRILQWIGIIIALLVIGGAYWYFSVRAGVKSNTSASQPEGTGRLDSGLAGYWKFDETTGSTAADASTNGDNGTLNNMENGDWVAGQIGNGLDFDGVDEYVSTSLPVASEGSVSAWVNGTFSLANSRDWRIFSAGTVGNHFQFGASGWGGYDSWYLFYRGSSGTAVTVKAPVQTDVQIQGWHHVVATWDTAKGATIYVDGISVVTSTTTTGSFGSMNYFLSSTEASQGWQGKMDETRAYDRILSADEVSQLYRLTSPTSVDTSLKGYWSFNGSDISGTTAYDRSGAGNTGTLTGGPVITNGIAGQALTFDGTDDYVSAGTNANITAAISLSVWAKTSDTTEQVFLSNRVSSTGYGFTMRGSAGNYQLRFTYFGVQDWDSRVNAYTADGLWHHYVVTNDLSNVYFYVDGVLSSTASIAGASGISSAGALQIGKLPAGFNTEFNGTLDEVRIYNRALSATDIKGLYDIAKPDATNSSSSQSQGVGRLDSDLAGYWKLDETTGSSASDSSTNGNTGTLTNMENGDWTTGQIGNGLNFGGTDEYINTGTTLTSADSITLSAWVNASSAVDGMAIFGNINGQTGSDRQCLMYDNSGTENISFGSGPLITVQVTLGTSAWHHVVYTNNGTTNTLYLDGVKRAENTAGALTTAAEGNVEIGSCIAGGGRGSYFIGKIDEARMYRRTLSVDEVSQLYRLTTPTSVDTGLKGYWSFNGQDMISSTTTADRSGAGNTGTLTNSPTITKGAVGQALRFNGSNNYVSLGTPASLGFAPSTVHTISAWANTTLSKTSSGLFQTIVALGSMGCCGTESSLSILDSGGSGIYQFRFALSGIGSINSTFDIVPNTWYHVVGAWDGTTAYIYINGVLNTSGTLSGSINNWTNNAYIGAADGPGSFFNGSIDEVRVYNRVLTAAEIKSQYDVAAPDKTNSSSSQAQGTGRLDSGLAGYWKLDDGSGTTPVDSSTTGHNGTFSGTPTWTTGQIGGALNFTGTESVSVGSFSLSRGTITAWVAPDASQFGADATYNVFGGTWSGGGFDLYHWLTNGSGSSENVVASITGPFGSTMACNLGANTATVASTDWVFYTLTFDTTSGCTVYRNAVPGNFTAGSTVTLGAQTYGIGTTGYYGSGKWKGKIDEVRVYDRILSPSEIAQIYNLTTPTGTDTSLKGYWSFNGQDLSGTTAYDRSGAGNNGTLTGGATAVRGKLGQGLSFDGANDYVAGGTPSVTTYPLTLATWFKTTNTPADYAQILMLGSGGSSLVVLAETIAAECGGAGKIKYGIRDTVSVTSSVCSTTTLNDGQWHHAVGVSSSASDHKLYIDGVLQNTSTTTLGTVTLTTTSIGGNTGAQFFSGTVDEVRIYNRALTASEVLGLYNQSR